MSKVVYVLTYENEPRHVYSDIEQLKEECKKWFNLHANDWFITRDYSRWLEDRNYPNNEDGEEQAWNDYIESWFENGGWHDYTWYECFLD